MAVKKRISPVEIVHAESRKVSCSGSRDSKNSIFGHPTSYLNMGNDDNVTCPYCGRYFKIKKK
jgi:uncharacterized Zn-finger protein